MISSAISGFPLSRVSSLRLLWRQRVCLLPTSSNHNAAPIAFRAFRPNFRTVTALRTLPPYLAKTTGSAVI